VATALITGASSGLGAEYARQLAARGADVVLVARDWEALEALAATLRRAHGVGVEVIVADLLDGAQLDRVVTRVSDRAHPVDVLVNNAGIGLPLDFERNDIEVEVRHLRLHDEVPMRLIHAAPIAAFMPRSTYGAAKGWLVSFSRWADVVYAPRGVSVTAVCAGFVHTNFHARLGLPPGEEGIPGWLWLDAPTVVSASLRDLARGRSVSIPSLQYKVLARLIPLLPDRLTASIGRRGR